MVKTLTDSFGRQITYLRISVTDRCNYRCTYCMPSAGVSPKTHQQILRYEQITQIVKEAALLGVHKVRLTGGEPLVRKGIADLVKSLAAVSGVEELVMTTNGSLLTPALARQLKVSGLGRVNISLDTLDPEEFSVLTRGGRIQDVLNGIEAAREAGLTPVKINTVVFNNTPPETLWKIQEYCRIHNLEMQTISKFTISSYGSDNNINTDRPQPCNACSRLRLTSDGYILPCLCSDKQIKVNFEDIAGSILAAVKTKPQKGESCTRRQMPEIGG